MTVPQIWTMPWLKSRTIEWMDRWNLHTNGIPDQLTIHGGCPVLVGSKWITNKWVESIWSRWQQQHQTTTKHQQHRWVRWHAQSLKLPCRRNILPWSGGRPGFERQPVKKWRKSKFSKKAWFFSFYLFSTSPYSKHTIRHCPALMSLAVVEEQLVQVSRLLSKERQKTYID